jgi:L-alanine-DL-glutamate epimerase-like enolase superfamily enzyme
MKKQKPVRFRRYRMKIEKMEIYRPFTELTEPFITSSPSSWVIYDDTKKQGGKQGTFGRRSIIIKLYTDEDEIGWGEASVWTTVTGETREMCLNALGEIFPKLVELDDSVMDLEKLHQVMSENMGLTPGAMMGIDIAVMDLFGKQCNQPLFKILGGYRDKVNVDRTISLKDTESMVKDAETFVNQGFNLLKFKVGINPKDDLERIKLIREAVGDDIGLFIDANQGWTYDQALYVLSKAGRYELEFAEQPIKMDDIEGLRKLRTQTSVPIMADETVCSASDALMVLEREAVDLISIKLHKCGGVWNAKKIVSICETFHIPNMISAGGFMQMLASVHLACGLRNIKYANLDIDHLYKTNIIRKGGTNVPPYKNYRALGLSPGLGIEEVDEKLLGKPTMIFTS